MRIYKSSMDSRFLDYIEIGFCFPWSLWLRTLHAFKGPQSAMFPLGPRPPASTWPLASGAHLTWYQAWGHWPGWRIPVAWNNRNWDTVTASPVTHSTRKLNRIHQNAASDKLWSYHCYPFGIYSRGPVYSNI